MSLPQLVLRARDGRLVLGEVDRSAQTLVVGGEQSSRMRRRSVPNLMVWFPRILVQLSTKSMFASARIPRHRRAVAEQRSGEVAQVDGRDAAG